MDFFAFFAIGRPPFDAEDDDTDLAVEQSARGASGKAQERR